MAAKAPYPVRLSDEIRAKLDALAKRERRKPSELARLLIEDGIAAAEAKDGPLLPEPRTPSAPSR